MEQKQSSLNQIDSTPLERERLLRDANIIVTKDRASTHGNAEDSFATIANFWSTYLGHDITSTQVAVMMTLMKIARIQLNPNHRDSWVDVAGYAACGWEVQHGTASRH